MYNQSKRWGPQIQEFDSIDFLFKKDQQIRRLQAELQQQRRKGSNAFKMLDSYRNISSQSQHSAQGLREQVTRRIKAEDQVKKLRKRNEQLEKGINEYLKILKRQSEINSICQAQRGLNLKNTNVL